MTKTELTQWLAARTRESYKPRYRFLTRRERLIYKNILLGFVRFEETAGVEFRAFPEEIRNAVNALLLDVPIIFYADTKGYILYDARTEVLLKYTLPPDEVARIAEIMDAALAHLRKKCEGKSELEKLIAVHNSLVDQVVYDLTDELPVHESHCVFLHRKAVCDGISKAAVVMFGALGIDSFLLTGEAHSSDYTPGENIRHGWNMVRFDGEFYHMDITFDNTLSQGNRVYSYNYFNLTDEQISADHEWDFRRISSGTAKVDYFTLTGRIISDEDALGDFFLQRLAAGERCFSFRLGGMLSATDTQTAAALFTKQLRRVGCPEGFTFGRYKYTDSYCLTIG